MKQNTPDQISSLLDVTDPTALLALFKQDKKTLAEKDSQFLKQTRFKAGKHPSGVEWTDFTCKDTSYGVGDGNTICEGKFARRGLPPFENELRIPKDKSIELIKFTKTNGDCCMFSYLQEHDLYLIATRNISILVKDLDELDKIENKNYTHKNLAKLWFGQLRQLNRATIGQLKRDLSGHTWIGEYLTEDNLIRYSDEKILFHSIVNNSNGVVEADACKTFERFGFDVVPFESLGEFILEEELLKAKIDEITNKTLVSTITQTEEGVVF